MPALVTAVLGILLGVLQSTLLAEILPGGAVPDLALILLTASAWLYGPLVGEISGFLIGLGFDSMSLSPLGFHAFLFTLVGYLAGRLQGNITPGVWLFPVLGVLAATALKYSGSLLLTLIFGIISGTARHFSLSTAIETAENIILTPVIFRLFTFADRFINRRRGGFR